MPFCIPRNPDLSSNAGGPGPGSLHLIQSQNTYKRFKISVSRLFRVKYRHHDTTFQNRQAVPDGNGQHTSVETANGIPRAHETPHHTNSFNPATMQDENCNPFPNVVEPATVPVTKQFEGAQGFTISGNPQFTNIGIQNCSVNFHGGTHGLENLKDFVSFAALYNSSAQDPDRCCHPGTRENVLTRLRQWIDNPNATDRIFWLYGPAGAGKSAIAQTIAHGYRQGEVTATFFFFRSDSRRNDGNRLFSTIAWQLAFSIPAAKNFIVSALDKTPHLPMTDVETQFEQLVAQVFDLTNKITSTSQMRHLAPVVVIDGVDECSDEQLQRRILAVIGNAVKNCRVPLRFLISSRPEALIEDTLNQFQEFTLRIDLATLDDANRNVEKYLFDKFAVIASKQGLSSTWPGQEIIEEIVFKSSGNFILASTLIRFIGDEDYNAVSQLDIYRKLKPRGAMSPFALLDELYIEILKQQRDQDFLKTFLALFIGRSFIDDNLHKDDATLMSVSEKELHIKLRRMRSLLKFKPFIDVYHKSFLDFLQDLSRSGLYHVSKQDGLNRYLGLMVDSVVRHVSMAIEQPNCHEKCCSSPQFRHVVTRYPPLILLPVEDWQEALNPLLHLQDKLLNTSKPQPCRVTQIMRDLLLHLVILQRISHHIAAVPAPVSNIVTQRSPFLMIEPMPEKDLDSCLSILLSYLNKTDSLLTVNVAMTDQLSSLLAFDCTETAARVRSVSDAQKLIDCIDFITNNQRILSKCGLDAGRKATHLASEIFARVPLLPTSFLNRSARDSDWPQLLTSYTVEKIVLSGMYDEKEDRLKFVRGNVTEQNGSAWHGWLQKSKQDESVYGWLQKSKQNLVTRMRVMLEVARTIRYIQSLGIALYSPNIESNYFFLDSKLRTKFLFFGLFAWWHREASSYGLCESDILTECMYESNVSAFGKFFYSVCFGGDNHDEPIHNECAWQLFERCRAEDPKSRPTIGDVVKEMESWDLT